MTNTTTNRKTNTMSLYLTIDHSEYIIPDSAPVASILKHLSAAKKLDINKLGANYIYVIGDKVKVTLSTKFDTHDIMTKTEYNKRLRALHLAIPAKAGPDAHGTDITNRTADLNTTRGTK